MARWKALPEGLDPMVVQLVAELRRMKDDSGLSLDQLARRTGYSASSWERYLGGRAFAPAGAVRALLETVGGDETSLMVLHRTAQEAWAPNAQTDPDAEADADDAAIDDSARTPSPADTRLLQEAVDEAASESASPAPAARPARRANLRGALNSVTSALVGAAVAVLVLQPWHHDRVATAAIAAPAKPASPAMRYTCDFTEQNGKWYAGHSTTDRDLIADGMSSPEVAEVQCLLQRAGIPTGNIDGDFGPKTLRAVIAEQIAKHLDVDGQVGPQTWAALRG